MIVVVAVMAMPAAALADGWSLQSLPTLSGALNSELLGVSCPATNDCYAVGFDEPSTGKVALIEHWNGSSWSVYNLGGPGTSSDLDSVSCSATSFCEAVGQYSTAAGTFPLAYTWATGGAFVQQAVPVASTDADDYLTGVSCQSASFCLAVGNVLHGLISQPLVEEWTGSAFGRLPGGDNSGNAQLNAVSCAAAQNFYCLGVGGEVTSDGVGRPYVVQFDDGSLESISDTGDGRFLVEPSGTPDSLLTGVSCLEASLCRVIGNYFELQGPSEVNPWAAITTSSGWSLQPVPPSDADAAFSTVNCPSECWAVGHYDASTGLALFADTLAGSTWEFASLPNPPGIEPSLSDVSCAQINDCEAVGYYRSGPNGTGAVVAFAEQYFYAVPSGCQHPPCRPPQPGTPHRFALTASGTEAHGATVIAVLRKPRTLVLLVQGTRRHRHVIIGLVPLGDYRVGAFRIRWNLRVDGKRLSEGNYELTLHSISVDVLSPPTPPGEIALTIQANGHVAVGK